LPLRHVLLVLFLFLSALLPPPSIIICSAVSLAAPCLQSVTRRSSYGAGRCGKVLNVGRDRERRSGQPGVYDVMETTSTMRPRFRQRRETGQLMWINSYR